MRSTYLILIAPLVVLLLILGFVALRWRRNTVGARQKLEMNPKPIDKTDECRLIVGETRKENTSKINGESRVKNGASSFQASTNLRVDQNHR